jgi:hypothetical protein
MVIIIFFSLFNFISSLKENTFYDRNYIARDMALVLDSIYMAPGNIQFDYEYSSKPLSRFNFYFTKTSKTEDYSVSITEYGEKGESNYFTAYPYAKNKAIKENLKNLQRPSAISFIKSGDILSNSDKLSLNRLECINQSEPKDFQKFSFYYLYESEDEKKILQSLSNLLKSGLSNVDSEHIVLQKDSVITVSSGMSLLVRLGNKKEAKYIKGRYFLDPKNKILLCNLLNSILDNSKSDLDISLIPADEDYFGIKPKKGSGLIELELNLGDYPTESLFALSKAISEALKIHGK